MSHAETPSAEQSSSSPLEETRAPDSSQKPAGKKKTGKTARPNLVYTYIKRGLAGFICFCIIGGMVIAGVFLQNPTIRGIFVNALKHPAQTFNGGHFDPTASYTLHDYFPPEKQKALTVLLLGVDHDYGGKRLKDGQAIPITIANTPTNPGRSDSIMLARFEFEDGAVSSINILSIPRDTRVTVPGRGPHKINAAHAYGGPELSMATIKETFGVDPDYYVDLNFEGFQQVVDTIGGVDVNVHQQLDYDDNWGNLHIHLKPGLQHLNGYKAMGYVRIRHTDNDLMRAQRQHEFLEALRDRVTSSPDLIMRLPDVVSSITSNLKSNLSTDQLITLLNLARKSPKENVRLETLPVIGGRTFVYIDRHKAPGLVRKMFFKDAQVAGMDVSMPDEEAPRHRKRRRHVRDTGGSGDIHTTVNPSASENTTEKTDANTSTSSPETQPGNSGKSDKQDKSGGDETTRPDSGSGSDPDKSSKGKEDSGTSSGTTSSVIRS